MLNTKNGEFIGGAILRLSQHHQGFCAAKLHTSTVGNVKIARSERSYYCYIHMPTFRIVWLLRNLSLGGNLCLRDEKMLRLYKFTIPCHCRRASKTSRFARA